MSDRIWLMLRVDLQDSEYFYDGVRASEELKIPLPSIKFIDILNVGNLLVALSQNLVTKFENALAKESEEEDDS